MWTETTRTEPDDKVFVASLKKEGVAGQELKVRLWNYAVQRLAEEGSDCLICVISFYQELMRLVGGKVND